MPACSGNSTRFDTGVARPAWKKRRHMTAEQKSTSNGMYLRGLAGKVAVVTGGSSGIGRATVVALARAGAKVALTTHSDISEGEDVLRELQPFAKKAIVRQVDVSREKDVEALFDACERELGAPSLLVNSAGINAAGIMAVDMTLDHWEKTLSTNLTSAFLTCRALARRLRARSSPGRIVNISSIHETIVFPGGADYDASKAGLRMLTRTLAIELAPHRINVNGIAPGMILTPMNQQAIEDPVKREEATRHIPWQRAGTADEVAGLILLLLSDAADYLTGETIVVDGGLSLNVGQGA